MRYRVAPVFEGNNLLANGVLKKGSLMETSVLYLCLYCHTGQNTPVRGKNRLNRDIWRARKVWDYMMTIGIGAQRRF